METKKRIRPKETLKILPDGAKVKLLSYDIVKDGIGKFYHQVLYKPPPEVKREKVFLVPDYKEYDAVEIGEIYDAIKVSDDFFRHKEELALREKEGRLQARKSPDDIDDRVEPTDSELTEIAKEGP